MKVRTMRGLEVDMAAMIAQNEGTVAVGNASMNARGDIIGRKGEIIKTRDEVAQEYHRSNPKAVRNVPLRNLPSETIPPAIGSDKMNVDFADPAAAVAALEAKAKKPARKIEDTDD